MRITTEQRDHLSERARNRRRTYLGLFVVAVCALLLLLATAGNLLLKKNPPEDLHDLVERAKPDGVWYFNVSQVRDLFLQASPSRPADDSAVRGLTAFQSDGTVLVYSGNQDLAVTPEPPANDWVVIVPIRKPQKFYHKAITEAMQEFNQRRDESTQLTFQVTNNRLLISNDKQRLESISRLPPRDAIAGAANAQRPAKNEAAFTYEGTLSAAGKQIETALEKAFHEKVGGDLKSCQAQASWSAVNGSQGDVVFRFALEEPAASRQLVGLLTKAGLASGLAEPPPAATHLEILIHDVSIFDEPSGEARLDNQWRWIP